MMAMMWFIAPSAERPAIMTKLSKQLKCFSLEVSVTALLKKCSNDYKRLQGALSMSLTSRANFLISHHRISYSDSDKIRARRWVPAINKARFVRDYCGNRH